MTEYSTPGVYVEERPSGPRPIEGVATSTAGFIGPTRVGPIDRPSDVLTSLGEFEREYGDGVDLQFADGTRMANYMWHAVRAFFENGGRRLHVARLWHEDDARPRSRNHAEALQHLEKLPEISIVAAPGATFGYARGYADDSPAIIQALLEHGERMRRFAVIDAGDAQSATEVSAMRARFDSSHGALYYPWVRIADPISRCDRHVPPCGFVAGIYARVDAARGVHAAPANEVINLATGLERDVGREQETLNAQGINCLRRLPAPNRGIVVWGNRTLGSGSEWKYVNLRRYLLYLEASIDQGTEWGVFEPNAEPLWNTMRRTIEDFLFNQWKAGALLGAKPEKAFFVKCDRTTMTQDDIDNGRLICLVGVAPVRPAEFVIIRIGQWTAERGRGGGA